MESSPSCTNETILTDMTARFDVQTCPNADGSILYRYHSLENGTGQGYDPFTGQFTGSKYVINIVDKTGQLFQPYTGGACQPITSTEQHHLELISKGSDPNQEIVVV
jgi:hypothetical protein